MSILPARFQVVDTRDPDEFVAKLEPFAGNVSLDISGRAAEFHCQISCLPLGDVGIFNGEYESGLQLRFSDFNIFAGSSAPISGTGEHNIGGREVMVSRTCGAVVSPGNANLRYGPGFEHLSITLSPAALICKLAAIIGDMPVAALRFDPAVDSCRPQTSQLDRLIRFVVDEAILSDSLSPILQVELQQAIMTSFLLANTNNYSGLLRGDPAAVSPRQVRIAEQFIEANCDRPITIEALAAAANVSARSLFYAFKSDRGYSPMDFVKRVRLERARQKLSNPDAGTSVSRVAYDCGFGNPGHFARDYRLQFGERPSATLGRGKAKA